MLSEKSHIATLTFSQKAIFMVFSLFFINILSVEAQEDAEFRQKIAAFAQDQADKYEKRTLNLADRNLGAIDNLESKWKEEFQLRSLEKEENNLGYSKKFKFYFSFYAYETKTDRQYTLKDWMEDFIEGQAIRAGRDMRTYQYATPTIILINDTQIITCNYKCSDFTEENFKQWKKKLLTYFGNDDTMVIEILCDGPLEWTKNAPDPRNRREMP